MPERDAAGALGDIYAAIRRTTKTPLVPTIYRHLATFPDGLEWAWRVFGPLMESQELPARAVRVRAAVPGAPTALFPAGSFDAAGLHEEALGGIANVLDVYNRINPINIVVVAILRRALEGVGPGAPLAPESAAPPATPTLPPLKPLPASVGVDALGPELTGLVASLTSPGSTAGDRIVPGLYRHLANWPPFLRLAAAALAPRYRAGMIAQAAAAVRAQAEREAMAAWAGLDAGVAGGTAPAARTGRAMAGSLEAFAARIPEMTVVGTMLRRTLPRDV